MQLNEEEAIEAQQGKLPPHDTTPGVFLQVGLELEDKQYVPQLRCLCVYAHTDCGRRALRLRAANGRSFSELAALQQKRNLLMRRIELWQEIQKIHMPMVAELRPADSVATGADTDRPQLPMKAELVPLWLPSALPAHLGSPSALLSGLRSKERRLREAQMADALAEIRRVRRILAAISEFSKMNVVGLGQRSVTRQQGLFTRFKDKQKRAAERYRAARVAMVRLDPAGGWQTTYRPLLDADLRGPRREDDEIIASEGRYQMSWIWLVSPSARSATDSNEPAGEEEFTETMRAEWARCKARADRWDEEKKLLLEEMRRVIEYFHWKARWWRDQAGRRGDASPRLRRGLALYAHKQSAVFEALARRTASFWVNFLRHMGPLPAWIQPYEDDARKVRSRKFPGATDDGEIDLGAGVESDSSSSSDSDDDDEQ